MLLFNISKCLTYELFYLRDLPIQSLLLKEIDCELRYTEHLSARPNITECKSPSKIGYDLC